MPEASLAYLGRGTKLGYSVATGVGPYTYTDIPLVMSISPKVTLGEEENVVLASTFKDYLPTIAEGTCDITIKFANGDASVAALVTNAYTGLTIHWKITYVDTTTDLFDGFITNYEQTIENMKPVEASFTIRMRTAPVTA